MKQILTVVLKEIKDNLRDKRAFFFAVIYGPVLMPLMLVGPMVLGAKNNFINFEATTELAVAGGERAPNLLQFLREHNLDATDAPANFREQLKRGDLPVVLEIPAEYVERLRTGNPAPLFLFVNHSSKESLKAANQVRSIISAYSAQLGYWRFKVRGLEPELYTVVKLVEEDISSEGLSGMMFGFILYFLMLFTMMTGGFYLAVDITAGERERSSLEPLLALAISRKRLVLGKYFAVLTFVLTSVTLAVLCLFILFKFMPMDSLTLVLNLNGVALLKAFCIALPCAFFIAGLLVATSAYTKSAKEAQTYISILYLLPLVPVLINQFADVTAEGVMLAVPLFGQFTLIDKVVKGDVVPVVDFIVSAGGAGLMAVTLILLAMHLYSRERILDNH